MRGKLHDWKGESIVRCLGVRFPEVDLESFFDEERIGAHLPRNPKTRPVRAVRVLRRADLPYPSVDNSPPGAA